MLLLQEFEFDIYHQPGVQRAMADYLSHLEYDKTGSGVWDEFPNAQLFKVATIELENEAMQSDHKWMMDMQQFLSVGLLVENMHQDEQKRLAIQSYHFCII